MEGFPTNCCYSFSQNGWMTAAVFLEFMQTNFLPFIQQNGIRRPVVLFTNLHDSRLSLKLLEFLRQEQVILYGLVPNATHVMQPLDLAVFRPVKGGWRELLADQTRQATVAESITRLRFVQLFSQVLRLKANPANIAAGFRKSGIMPRNPSALAYDKLVFWHDVEAPAAAVRESHTTQSEQPATIEQRPPQMAARACQTVCGSIHRCIEELIGAEKLQELLAQKASTCCLQMLQALLNKLNGSDVVSDRASDEHAGIPPQSCCSPGPAVSTPLPENFADDDTLPMELEDEAPMPPLEFADGPGVRLPQETAEEALPMDQGEPDGRPREETAAPGLSGSQVSEGRQFSPLESVSDAIRSSASKLLAHGRKTPRAAANQRQRRATSVYQEIPHSNLTSRSTLEFFRRRDDRRKNQQEAVKIRKAVRHLRDLQKQRKHAEKQKTAAEKLSGKVAGKLPEPNALSALVSLAQRMNCVLGETARYGNCFFESVEQALRAEGISADAAQLRAQACDFLLHNPVIDGVSLVNFLQVPFSAYIASMRRPSTYADHVSILSLANSLNRQIHIYQPQQPAPIKIIPVSEKASGTPLRVAHIPEHHYMPLLPINVAPRVTSTPLPQPVHLAKVAGLWSRCSRRASGGRNGSFTHAG